MRQALSKRSSDLLPCLSLTLTIDHNDVVGIEAVEFEFIRWLETHIFKPNANWAERFRHQSGVAWVWFVFIKYNVIPHFLKW